MSVIEPGESAGLKTYRDELVRGWEMYLSDRFLRVALLGMGHDPEDIIEYIAECSSVAVSFLLGIAATICTWKIIGTWLAPIAGLEAYALGIAFGYCVFLRDYTKG